MAATYPSYIALYESGGLAIRVKKLYKMLECCELCPRECGVNRLKGEKGFCRSGVLPIVSSYNEHMGEEPPISGYNGSGTIFMTNCTLKCIYCQNYPISQLGNGRKVTVSVVAKMMLDLEKRGCHNINFVTPTHFVAQIVHAVLIAVKQGFGLPIVYNTSGYESLKTLKLLDGIVDIYMPDMKYDDDETALKYSHAPGYKEANRKAVKEMLRQVGQLETDKNGIAKRGILIRHLVLPGGLSGSKEILKYIKKNLGAGTYISLMSQYFPAYKAVDDPILNKRVNYKEYNGIVDYLHELGLNYGWTQGLDA
jgi:putative pyruvate formate lyase activating enzyme